MNSIYEQIQQLYYYMYQQENRLAEIEKKLQQLTPDKHQNDKRPVTIEKLEYHFDQLKVETLEGTLNIGLSPQDINNMEDLDLPISPEHETVITQPTFKNALNNKLLHYLDNDIMQTIRDTEAQLNKHLDPQSHEFIKNDLKEQLPQRLNYYINMFAAKNNRQLSEEQLLENMYKRMRADMDQAIFSYIAQLPIEAKGENKHADEHRES